MAKKRPTSKVEPSQAENEIEYVTVRDCYQYRKETLDKALNSLDRALDLVEESGMVNTDLRNSLELALNRLNGVRVVDDEELERRMRNALSELRGDLRLEVEKLITQGMSIIFGVEWFTGRMGPILDERMKGFKETLKDETIPNIITSAVLRLREDLDHELEPAVKPIIYKLLAPFRERLIEEMDSKYNIEKLKLPRTWVLSIIVAAFLVAAGYAEARYYIYYNTSTILSHTRLMKESRLAVNKEEHNRLQMTEGAMMDLWRKHYPRSANKAFKQSNLNSYANPNTFRNPNSYSTSKNR